MTSQTPVNPQPALPSERAGLKAWLGLATLVLPVILISVDMTVLGFAVPHLSADLQPTGEQLLWIVDIYGFLIAGFLITMGSLGDRVGRRRLLMIGSAAFGAASALAAFSTSPEMLIGARALLGIAGATLMPSTLSLIRSLFPDPKQRVVAIAVWASAFSAGAAFGPILGGVLLEHFFWGSVFLINLPVIVLILIALPLLVTESKDPNPGRIDAVSVGLSLLGMLSTVYGIKRLVAGDISVLPLVALALGLTALVIFVHRQRRLTHPLLDLSLFSIRRFRAGVVTNFMLVFSMVGALFFLTQLLQTAYEMRPVHASLVLIPGLILSVVASFIVIPIARRLALRTVIAGGLLIAAAGMASLTLLPVTDGMLVVLIAFALLGLGTGLTETLTNDAILTAAPPHRAGAASAISETAYEFGGALGVAVMGSVLTFSYRTQLTGAELPESVPARTVEGASETISAASVAAERLGGTESEALWSAARESFVQSVHLTGGIAAGIVLATILTVWVLLRNDTATVADQAAAAGAGPEPDGAAAPASAEAPAPTA
ncbi:MFS transporter [Nesterenkonia flava]|uniref:MFS transporter n=1 Tax=Nesterenkonia flava TaxID=469799 RepID=A0ABU1FQG1_9MICC|nr:MFS transporter [Nesterenkonia flava]MDR5710892.1 MFS transporter [Nesterenkonia flava]